MNVAVSNVPGPRERGHIGGAPVSEIYSVGVLSAGSAFNMTVWSYVDQVDIAVLSDDRTFDDTHEATDAMVHAFGEIRARAGWPTLEHRRHRDGPGAGRRLTQLVPQDLARAAPWQLRQDRDVARHFVIREAVANVLLEGLRRRRRPGCQHDVRDQPLPVLLVVDTEHRRLGHLGVCGQAPSPPRSGRRSLPPETIISSSRPTTNSRPASSRYPMSPDAMKPSWKSCRGPEV